MMTLREFLENGKPVVVKAWGETYTYESVDDHDDNGLLDAECAEVEETDDFIMVEAIGF